MPLQPIEYKDFLKGLNSSTSRPSTSPGTLPRMSNLVLTRRGGLVTVDGSKIVNAFNGVPTANRGRDMCTKLFSPTGVARYYLRIMKVLDIHLGRPLNLIIADGGVGGTLVAGTYFYVVTAVDGVGGETLASNEVSIIIGVTPHLNTLTWNIVPNAQGYNIYRGMTTGSEILLTNTNLPAPQAAAGSLTVTYIDDGSGMAIGNPISIAAVAIPGVRRLSPRTASPAIVSFNTIVPHNLSIGNTVTAAGIGNPSFNAIYTVTTITSNTSFTATTTNPATINFISPTVSGGGSVTNNTVPPIVDTTQQCGLFKMPPAAGGIVYTNANIQALYPADLPILDGGTGGGGGGGGGTGGGPSGSGQQGSTPSGGIPGNTSFIPQMEQFQNQMAIALGNAYPPQVYKDPTGTFTNPAIVSKISTVTVDAFGVVTVTTSTPHGMVPSHVGGNVILSGILNPLYNQVGPTLSIPSSTTFKLYNPSAIGQAASSGGIVTLTSLPLISTFSTAYPPWATAVTYLTGDIVVPTVPNGHYYKCVQAGVSTTQPTWPLASGAQVIETGAGAIIWQEAGLTNTTAPPPPGAAHIAVYSGSLWVWNTWYTNTSNGLDGPTCLRMSDNGNLNSWNPINQAFIDKDDGTEGMGIGAFTITGFGIPPEGSLIAFKLISGYQIVGVFGSPSFLIQRIKSSCGCTAPRTLQFLTGFGLMRFSHLGFTLFDGINDRVMSEEVKNYIYPSNALDVADITTVDFSWTPVSWAAQTVYPPMYVCAMPIGDSKGKLTRIFAYDMVLKCWAGTIDLPFAISTLTQAIPVTNTGVTLCGTFNDGALHRLFAGDATWDNSIDTPGPSPVNFSAQPPELFVKGAQHSIFYCKELIIRGLLFLPTATFSVSYTTEDEAIHIAETNFYILGTANSLFVSNTAVQESGISMIFSIKGSGPVEFDNFTFMIEPTDPTVPPRIT